MINSKRYFLEYLTSAFSLVELMVVIAIVAILAAIAIPSYKTYRDNSKVVEIVGLAQKSLSDWENSYTTNTAYPAATGPLGSYVQTIVSSGSGISITLNNPSNIDTTLNGAVITYTPNDNNGAISWACSVSTGSGTPSTYYTYSANYRSGYTVFTHGLYRFPHHGGGLTTNTQATALICGSTN